MTPSDLEQAMRQFEAQGGKVDVVAGFEGVAAYRGHIPEKPKEIFKRPPREVPAAVLETIRGFGALRHQPRQQRQDKFYRYRQDQRQR